MSTITVNQKYWIELTVFIQKDTRACVCCGLWHILAVFRSVTVVQFSREKKTCKKRDKVCSVSLNETEKNKSDIPFMLEFSMSSKGLHNTINFKCLKYACKSIFFLLHAKAQLKVWMCLLRIFTLRSIFFTFVTAKDRLHMLTCALLSLLSDPALRHFNRATPTERQWQRAKCSPSTPVTQRTSAGSILWHPLWCRACICWLVKQRTYIFKDKSN